MLSKRKKIISVIFIWLALFLMAELSCFAFLRIYYNYRTKNAEYPRIFTDAQLYLSRFHPLFTNNDDLRAKNPDLDFDPIVGYKFAANTIHPRPYADYTGYIEIDSQGFVHNGDPDRNKLFFDKESNKIFRVIFLGGSTVAGRGASRNEFTIPAYFERLLQKQWPNVEFHVLNTGTWGYHSTEERLYYSFYVKPFLKPDLLIFIDGDNDAMLAGIQKDWKPYFHDMKFDNKKYRDIYRPSVAFSNFVQDLKRFPQPLYILFFLDRFLYKTRQVGIRVARPEKMIEFVFHEEGISQFRNNLLSCAREISFENTDAFFFLQPVLGINKNTISDNEKKNLQSLEIIYQNYLEVLRKYLLNFSLVYQDLQTKFQSNSKINFIDISDIFVAEPSNIYVSGWHCNDYGYKLIAEKIFYYTKESIAANLKKNGLLENR